MQDAGKEDYLRPSERIGLDCVTGFVQILESPGTSWTFIVQNSRPWKVLGKGIGPEKYWKNPGKSWNCKLAVLELLVLV